MLTIHHYNVAVHDLEASVRDYADRFGMQRVGGIQHNDIGNFDAQAMGYGEQAIVRLITPSARDAPVAKFMAERANDLNPHGEGFYMVAFECDDVDAFCAQVRDGGGRIIRNEGASNAWVHPLSSHFVFMEVVPRRS